MYLKLFLHSYFRFYFAQLQLGAGFCRKFLNLISHRSIPPLYQLAQVKYIAEKGSRKPINYFGTTALGKVVKVESSQVDFTDLNFTLYHWKDIVI